MNTDKCKTCPINSKKQYLKNMVCKNNCPRDQYHNPLDVKTINLQHDNLMVKFDIIASYWDQVRDLEARVKKAESDAEEFGQQAEKGLKTTIELITMVENKLGIKVDIPEALQPSLTKFINEHKSNTLNSFSVNGIEFKSGPIATFANINNSQSKMQ